ncbi:MAG: hypothetical protein B6I18_03930 [Bacteroidetes bacterium 4572_112]|nr:MAG: hypothetical protein B6I18_03930 [Bacteroidetes bacterium 4572_112]
MKNQSNFKNWHVFYYLGLLFLFTLSNNAYSQQKGGLSFGAKGGLALGNFSTQNHIQVGSIQYGMHAAGFANYSILDYLDVSVEVLYSNTGASNLSPEYFYAMENAILPSKIVNTSIITHQISIPILISYVFNATEGIYPRVYIGGDIGFNLKSNSLNTSKTSFNGNNIFVNQYESMGTRMANNDFGAIIGTAISFGKENISYTIDARYRLGLSNINESTSSYINSELTRDVFSIMVGVAYKLSNNNQKQ